MESTVIRQYKHFCPGTLVLEMEIPRSFFTQVHIESLSFMSRKAFMDKSTFSFHALGIAWYSSAPGTARGWNRFEAFVSEITAWMEETCILVTAECEAFPSLSCCCCFCFWWWSSSSWSRFSRPPTQHNASSIFFVSLVLFNHSRKNHVQCTLDGRYAIGTQATDW